MASDRLIESGTTVLDANGDGTVQMQVGYNQRWQIDRAQVLCGQLTTPIPRCVIYRQSVQDANAVTGTYTGNQDTAEFPRPVLIEGGESLFTVWTGGTPGDTATVTIAGLRVMA